MIASGAPPALAALTLAFNTNLFGGLTHYASGQSAVYFSSGAISLPALWKQGAYMSVVNFLIFGRGVLFYSHAFHTRIIFAQLETGSTAVKKYVFLNGGERLNRYD